MKRKNKRLLMTAIYTITVLSVTTLTAHSLAELFPTKLTIGSYLFTILLAMALLVGSFVKHWLMSATAVMAHLMNATLLIGALLGLSLHESTMIINKKITTNIESMNTALDIQKNILTLQCDKCRTAKVKILKNINRLNNRLTTYKNKNPLHKNTSINLEALNIYLMLFVMLGILAEFFMFAMRIYLIGLIPQPAEITTKRKISINKLAKQYNKSPNLIRNRLQFFDNFNKLGLEKVKGLYYVK